MIRKIIYWSIKIYFTLFTRLEVLGIENIPENGGAIIAINHPGRMEIYLAFGMTKRNDVTGLAAEKYESHWFYHYLIEAIDGIFIDRFNPDFGALKKSLAYLKKGWLLGIAPEGTRSPTIELTEGKQGVSFLASKSGVPVIPTGAVIPRNSFMDSLKLKRPKVSIKFGKAFILPPTSRESREKQLQEGAEEIMCQIAALLPENMHGFYSDHPRLKDLLTKNNSSENN